MTDIVERLQAAMDGESEVNSFEAMRDAKAEIERLLVHYNLLRDALSWFDAHNIDHLPQWVVSARYWSPSHDRHR